MVPGDHVHPEYWTQREHERFEDRVSKALGELRDDVDRLTTRITLLLGGLGVLVFIVNLVAPVIAQMLKLPH